MLYTLSRPDSAVPVEWARVPAFIAGPHAARSQGLYVFFFENEAKEDVYDNNKTPKIVVRGRSASLKPGKFEQGFLHRLCNYNAHLHRPQPNAEPEWVFRTTFRGGYLLDLSTPDFAGVPKPARVFESYWIQCINRFAHRSGILAESQLTRAEWRYLHSDPWTPELTARFQGYIEMVKNRICAMAEAAKLSADTP